MSLISIKNLSKTYHDEEVATHVLHGMTFDIGAGEFVAVMGPSGCGKSTLLHILGFLDNPSAGQYHFEGKEVGRYSEEEIARVRNEKMGFIFQSFNLLPRTTVLDNVKLPLVYSGVEEGRWDDMATKAIEAVGLSHRIDFEPSQLSGGEKQRVAIARALVNSPQVIFADEPTGNLDSKSGLLVMNTIQRLNEEMGHTIILVTHETYTAEHAERIIRLKDGLIESDTKVPVRRKGDGFIK